MCEINFIGTTIYYSSLKFENSPLLAALRGGYTETAQLLTEKGADVNISDKVHTCAI